MYININYIEKELNLLLINFILCSLLPDVLLSSNIFISDSIIKFKFINNWFTYYRLFINLKHSKRYYFINYFNLLIKLKITLFFFSLLLLIWTSIYTIEDYKRKNRIKKVLSYLKNFISISKNLRTPKKS